MSLRIEAPPEKLRRLRELRSEVERRRKRDSAQLDVFEALHFEPNCIVRSEARDRGRSEDDLPPPCGRCPQERFLDLPDENLDVLLGGAGGGGKSVAMLIMALRTCVRYPGIQVFWFRCSFPELNQSVLRLLVRFGYGKALGCRWDGSKYELRFPGGSILTFAHAKNLKEAAAMSSAEINLLMIDERTTIDPEVVDFLYTRVRSGTPGVPCLGIRSATNPGHVGHSRVKAGWVDATDHGRHEIVDAAGRRRLFIPAKASDNPYVGDYEATLAGIEDPALRARIRDGDWSAMPDQAFPDWNRERLLVPPFEIPPSWERHGGLDYGWTAPSVFLAAARDNDGRVWFYRELTMRQTPEREQARRILATESGVARIAADPSMWGKSGSALPPASQFALEGCKLTKGDNDRIGGKGRMHTYLAEAPACRYHDGLGWVTCPMLHILDGSCPELVQTMSELTRDPHRPEDVDTRTNDHWYDSCLVAGTVISTRRGGVPIEQVHVGDEVMTRRGWRRVREAERTGIDKPVITVTGSDHRTLTGTAEHPVYTVGRGFVRLDTLRYSDILLTWSDKVSPAVIAEWRPSFSVESGSAATLTPVDERMLFTSHPARKTALEESGVSIKRCGRLNTVRSRTGSTFTTATTTQTTTILTTWCASQISNTAGTTPISQSPSHSARRGGSTNAQQLRGIPAKKVEHGINSTPRIPASGTANRDWRSASSVTDVMRSQLCGRPAIGSARTIASQAGDVTPELITRAAPVKDADQHFELINTLGHETVPVSVRGLCAAGTADVYNLSVEGEEEYFANGILVHNCRYLIMGVGRVPLTLLKRPTERVPTSSVNLRNRTARITRSVGR